MVAGINEILQEQDNEQCSVHVVRCLFIPKLFIIIIIYCIILLFSIALFIAFLIDVLVFIAYLCVVSLLSKGKKDRQLDECIGQLGTALDLRDFFLSKFIRAFMSYLMFVSKCVSIV